MRVLIIGAGMSGLVAAGRLVGGGHQVTLVDKGRAVGGRMATKRFDGARFDIGAQHFSVRTPEFAQEVEVLRDTGIVDVWFHGRSISEPDRGLEPRFKGMPAMRSIPEHLAVGLDVRLDHRVARIEVTDDAVIVDDLPPAERCIVTAPAPQTLDLLDHLIDGPSRRRLGSIEYQPCLAVMLTLDGHAGLEDGHLALEEGPIAWMADNHHKGVSEVPAVTVHSSHDFAARHHEEPPEVWVPILAESAARHLGARTASARGHRWRYSLPRNPLGVGALRVHERIVVAGEALAGAKVEGAFVSGLAGAAEILA